MARSRLRAWFGGIALGALWAWPGLCRAQDAWDSVYISNVKVGYIHTKVEPVTDKDGTKYLRVRYDSAMDLKRGRDKVHILFQYGTIEKPDGTVLKMETRLVSGQGEMRTFGEVQGDQMNLALESGGQQQRQSIPWSADIRGPYAPEMSLSREPMKPGDTRTIKTFFPVLNKVGLTKLVAKQPEEIELGGGVKRTLLHVEGTSTDLKGNPILEGNSSYWVDKTGQILKTFTDVFGGQTTYRTTKEVAMVMSGGAQLDMIDSSIIKVTHKIPEPEKTRGVVYRIQMPEDRPAEVFPADTRQTVRKEDEHTIVLEVRSRGPNDGQAGSQHVADEYLRSNTQINSEDPTVIELTRKAVGDRTDPWQKAVAIEHWVATNMVNKNFQVAFANAAEVAKSLAGDCTEHSVLLAAMCRAAGIPARAAVGLVYADHLGGFGFHQWNEVYVNRRWVALDAAFDQSEVDAVHIKMADSSMDGVSPFETFMSVARVCKKTKIEVREISR